MRAEIDANSTQLAAIVADTNVSKIWPTWPPGSTPSTKTDAIVLTGNLVQVVLHDATAAGLATLANVDTGNVRGQRIGGRSAGGTVDEQAIAARLPQTWATFD